MHKELNTFTVMILWDWSGTSGRYDFNKSECTAFTFSRAIALLGYPKIGGLK